MYRTGVGAPQDPALADEWRLREQALQAQENNDILIAQEGEKREASEFAGLVGVTTLLGGFLLADLTTPVQCKIVDSYEHSQYHSYGDMRELVRAQKEIEEQHIHCPK